MDLTIRPARSDDVAAVESFTEDTWPDHGGDYVPRVFDSWVEETAGSGGSAVPARTLVATDADDRPVGLLRTVLLSLSEAWCGGLRVDPDHRGEGIARRLCEAAFDWAREHGATVARCMVFSWNAAGLGTARAAGFESATEFRWAHPTPDFRRGGTARTEPDHGDDAAFGVAIGRDGASEPTAAAVDPDAVWSYWHGSRTRAHLDGLALDPAEPWALSSLTRGRLDDAADEGRLVAVGDGPDVDGVGVDGVRGFAVRVRVSEYEPDDVGDDGAGHDDGGGGSGDRGGAGPERWAEYGVADWADAEVATRLFRAITRDAASVDAEKTRVLIPETARAVSDAALARVELSESPDFVLAADLTGPD